MVGNGAHLLVGDEGAVDAGDLLAAGHIEHVALAEELLRALLAEDRAAVDLGRDREADPGREFRLDDARDDVDRRALRGHDEMDACGARLDRKSTRLNSSNTCASCMPPF